VTRAEPIMQDEPLRSLLASYPPHLQPEGPVVRLGPAGGLSGAWLWRFRAAVGELVCRAWPAEGPDEARLAAIHGWLGRCRGLSFVAVPFSARDGRTYRRLAGRFWELAPWLAGEPDLSDPPGRGHVEAAFGALAALHRRLVDIPTVRPSPGLGRRVCELDELLAGGFKRIRATIEAHPGDPLVELGHRWLAFAGTTLPGLLPELRDRARLAVPLQPCLRDTRPDHFLFQGEALSGLVDYGAMAIDSVAGDLARLLGEWLPGREDLRAAALAAYRDVRPLDESEAALIAAFEAAADVLIAGHWIRWHFQEQRQFDDPEAVPRGIEKGLARLERLARDRGVWV
jgi:homoserine kinase type II